MKFQTIHLKDIIKYGSKAVKEEKGEKIRKNIYTYMRGSVCLRIKRLCFSGLYIVKLYKCVTFLIRLVYFIL